MASGKGTKAGSGFTPTEPAALDDLVDSMLGLGCAPSDELGVMGDESEAEGAVHAASFSIESEKQPVIVEKREKEDNPREHSPPQPANNKPDSVEKPSTVYVGRLSHETSERRLREFFETYGTVTDAKLVCDLETGASRGFAFVKFLDPRDAEEVVRECNGKVLDGRAFKVSAAKYPSRGGCFGRARGGSGRGPPRGGFYGDSTWPHSGSLGRGRGGYGRDEGVRDNFVEGRDGFTQDPAPGASGLSTGQASSSAEVEEAEPGASSERRQKPKSNKSRSRSTLIAEPTPKELRAKAKEATDRLGQLTVYCCLCLMPEYKDWRILWVNQFGDLGKPYHILMGPPGGPGGGRRPIFIKVQSSAGAYKEKLGRYFTMNLREIDFALEKSERYWLFDVYNVGKPAKNLELFQRIDPCKGLQR